MPPENTTMLDWGSIVDSLIAKIRREQKIDFSESKVNWFSEDGVLSTLPKSPSILDYGSGTGVLGLMLAKRLGASSLTQADQEDKRYDHCAEFIRIQKNLPPQTDKSFDVIILSDVLQYVEENQRISLLSSLLKKLTPEGRLIVQIYNSQHTEQMQSWWDVQQHDESNKITFLSVPEVQKSTTASGFIVRSRRTE